MADKRLQEVLDESIDTSVGFEAKDDGFNINAMYWLTNSNNIIPPWWSRNRDIKLTSFWKETNQLSTAVYAAQSKLVGIPFRVVARDPTIPDHVDEAVEITYMISAGSEFLKGWTVAYAKFIEDLLTQDNGAFLEVIGDGLADGPIIGKPFSVRHLDSSRCQRTSNPEFPVLYTAEDDKMYALHWTRVISMAQMPSARRDMRGVGLCAVSRASLIAQTLLDISIYKQELLGSRPANMMLIGKGITGKQIEEAFMYAARESQNAGLKRYARTIAIGSENPDIDIKRVDLKTMEPFDEETTTTLGMFAIAAAFGMDAGELWPMGGGAVNKADSALRRLRSRGKLPAQTTSDLALQFNMKVVPPYLKVMFDFKDDEEDQQRALIRDIRGRNRERDIGTGTINTRTARQRMLEDGDLSRVDFVLMEAEDGRLPDGTTIEVLYHSTDPVFNRHLGSNNGAALLIMADNDQDEAIADLQERRSGALKELSMTTSARKKEQLKLSVAALNWLEEKYHKQDLLSLPEVPIQNRRSGSQITRLTSVNIDGDIPEEDSPSGESPELEVEAEEISVDSDKQTRRGKLWRRMLP